MEKGGEGSSIFYRSSLKKEYPKIDHGEGVYLIDQNGKKYIDGLANAGVVNMGYFVPEVVDAMAEQAKKLPFLQTTDFTSQIQEDVARKVVEWAPEGMNKVYFSLSGAQANEIALKLARQYHMETGNPNKFRVIGRWQSYHGYSLGSISMSGRTGWRKNYAPYLMNFPHIPLPYCYRCPFKLVYSDCGIECAYELERVIRQEESGTISAFIAETISGMSCGAVIPPKEYFPIIRSICDKYNVLLILDEVITGIGRTGKTFAIKHWDVVPDMIATAKGITGGFAPLAVTIVKQKIYDAIYNGSGSFADGITFSGHPVSCAASVATLNYLEKNKLVERVEKIGAYFLENLLPLRDMDIVGDVRGKGLLLAVEFVSDKKSKASFPRSKKVFENVKSAALAKGLVIGGGVGTADGVDGDICVMTPPFIITKEEVDKAIEILKSAIEDVQKTI